MYIFIKKDHFGVNLASVNSLVKDIDSYCIDSFSTKPSSLFHHESANLLTNSGEDLSKNWINLLNLHYALIKDAFWGFYGKNLKHLCY